MAPLLPSNSGGGGSTGAADGRRARSAGASGRARRCRGRAGRCGFRSRPRCSRPSGPMAAPAVRVVPVGGAAAGGAGRGGCCRRWHRRAERAPPVISSVPPPVVPVLGGEAPAAAADEAERDSLLDALDDAPGPKPMWRGWRHVLRDMSVGAAGETDASPPTPRDVVTGRSAARRERGQSRIMGRGLPAAPVSYAAPRAAGLRAPRPRSHRAPTAGSPRRRRPRPGLALNLRGACLARSLCRRWHRRADAEAGRAGPISKRRARFLASALLRGRSAFYSRGRDDDVSQRFIGSRAHPRQERRRQASRGSPSAFSTPTAAARSPRRAGGPDAIARQSPTEAQVRGLIEEADTDGSGHIDFGEFKTLDARALRRPVRSRLVLRVGGVRPRRQRPDHRRGDGRRRRARSG